MLASTHRVILHDISLTGAQVGADPEVVGRPEPRPGEAVMLQWGPYEKMGHFVWITDTLGGMTFDETVTPRELIGTRDLYDEFVRSGGMPADAARYANEWVNGTR